MSLITLISPYQDVSSLGIRHLSSFLRVRGHATRLVFLPNFSGPEVPGEGGKLLERDYYAPTTVRAVTELSKDSALVGISVMTNYLPQAVQLTRSIRERLGSPVVWGGIHPSVCPESCLDHTDYVIRGEGEEALADLLTAVGEGREAMDLANVGCHVDGAVRLNPVRPLERNLDALPLPDYSGEDHWLVAPGGRTRALEPERLREALAESVISRIHGHVAYQTMSSRGCPHHCTYCCNNALLQLYGGRGYTRFRSPEHVIGELRLVREQFPWVERVGFSDDCFFARNTEEFRHFAELYRREVGLPFNCLVSPTSVSREKMALAVEAGCVLVQLGIETASPRVMAIYQRNYSVGKLLETIRIVADFAAGMHRPHYDLIINNPLETVEDHLATLQFLLAIPYPYHLQLFSLVPYPGTELVNLYREVGLPTDYTDPGFSLEYSRREVNYPNLCYALFSRNVSPVVMRLLVSPRVVRFFSRPVFSRVGQLLYRAWRALRKKGG
jgi:anaerobic magnesium-protoporphyrin IX monomethyl ester cyclase